MVKGSKRDPLSLQPYSSVIRVDLHSCPCWTIQGTAADGEVSPSQPPDSISPALFYSESSTVDMTVQHQQYEAITLKTFLGLRVSTSILTVKLNTHD